MTKKIHNYDFEVDTRPAWVQFEEAVHRIIGMKIFEEMHKVPGGFQPKPKNKRPIMLWEEYVGYIYPNRTSTHESMRHSIRFGCPDYRYKDNFKPHPNEPNLNGEYSVLHYCTCGRPADKEYNKEHQIPNHMFLCLKCKTGRGFYFEGY